LRRWRLFTSSFDTGGSRRDRGPDPADPSGPTLVQSADWVTFGHDLERSSLQSSAGGLTAQNVKQLTLLWSYQSASKYDIAGPIEAGGIVYAVDTNGNLAAFNAQSGAVVWKRALNAQVKMTPALLDGRLFVGTHVGTTGTSLSTIYALNPATGSILWQHSVDGGTFGSPVAIAGRLYLPVAIGDKGYCHPGGIFVFNEATGAPGFEWLTEAGSVRDGGAVWSSVTYDGSRLLFGTGNTCVNNVPNANAVVSISTLDAFRWAYQTALPLTDDDVGGTVFEHDGIAYVDAKNGSTYAMDPASGAIRWSRNLGAPDGAGGFSTPAMVGSTLVASGGFPADPYVANPNITQYGMLYGLNPATGAQLWKVTATSPFWSPVATTSDLVITTPDANVADIDAATGATVWSTPIIGYSRAQPAIAGGEVFVADSSGHLYAFGLPTTANAESRKRFESVLRNLPKYHVVPFDPGVPKYCRL